MRIRISRPDILTWACIILALSSCGPAYVPSHGAGYGGMTEHSARATIERYLHQACSGDYTVQQDGFTCNDRPVPKVPLYRWDDILRVEASANKVLGGATLCVYVATGEYRAFGASEAQPGHAICLRQSTYSFQLLYEAADAFEFMRVHHTHKGVGTRNHGGCRNDMDCKGDRICVKGNCISE